MTINRLLAGVMGGVMLGYIGLAKIANAEEYKAEGWKTPDVSSAEYVGNAHRDLTKRIRGKETEFEIYKNPDGSYFNKLKIKGNTFCYVVDTDGKLPMEYNLIDSEGDGLFELKTETDYKKIPEWVLK